MKTLLLTVALAVGLCPAVALAAGTDTPLIPREKLFGNPTKAGGKLSPDGKWLAYIAPRDGVLNIFVAPIADPAKAKPLTDEKTRPIRAYFWAPDSKSLLFVNDKGGDENFLLYGVDIASAAQKTLTPFEKTRVRVIGVSPHVKDHILIGLNNRDPKWHDVYSLDLSSGKLSEVLKNEGGYAGFIADDNLILRGANRPNAAGGTDFFKIAGNTVAADPFASTGLEDAMTTSPVGYTSDGKTLYWIDSRGRDKAALIAEDVASGKKTVIGESGKADIDNTITNPETGKVEAYAVNYLKSEWTAVDPALKADFAFLAQHLKGDITVTSQTADDSKWTVAEDSVTAPPAVYLYDRKAKTVKKLYVSRPELEGAPLVAMHAFAIKTRDGLEEVSYLTLPKGVTLNAKGHASKAVPMVLFVHGGPWARDEYGYNAYHQWLANRGYAVLSVNYRGSTGFGKAYIEAANLQWGLKMHDDLIDAVDWAIKAGVTTKDKVAIMGGSYGGYATLAGLTFTPDVFACGVDIVGPSNLNTLLKTIPAYWEPIKLQFYKRMGDPTTPEGQKILHDASPLFAADKIVKPLLIGQGANDPRVNQAESDQIVKAMAEKNIPVTYVLFPDEGHGFARPVNAIAFNAVAEEFLAKNLGGRAEPIGETVKASTAKVPHGAEFVNGLPEALKAEATTK